jgi:hypothetical protein
MLAALLDGCDRSSTEVAVEIYSFMDGGRLNWLRDPTITHFADPLFARRASTR